MACCILILLYVTDELSYDNFHVNKDRIYRIHTVSAIGTTSRNYASIPPILAPDVARSIPDIEASARIFGGGDFQVRVQGKDVEIQDIFFVDPDFLKIFTYEFIHGDSGSVMANPDSLVITQEIAQRLFGSENPVGKAIVLPGPGNRTIQVTGVIKNIPRNSQFRFNGLIPTGFLRDQQGRPAPVLTANYFCEVWGYFLLKKDADPNEVEKKMAVEAQSKWGDLYKQRGTTRTYLLQKLNDVHLRSHFEFELGTPGDINNVYLFSAIALLVLLIACFNFINLSTARSANRAREVGIRKVLGSAKSQLIRQFLNESIAVSMISLILSIFLVITVFPSFNALSGKHFAIGQLISWPILLGFLGIIILTGFIAGSFPAFILSAFSPIMVLKGKFSAASKNSALRKTLVIVQFSISVFMIVGILIMVRQLDFMKNKDLGFNKQQLVVVPFFGSRREATNAGKFDAMRERILQNPGVVSLSFSANVPGRELGYDAYLPEGGTNQETVRAQNYWVDHDFLKSYGIELVAGRDFSRDFSTDTGQAVILNEKAAEAFGWGKDAIGKRIYNVPRNNRLGVVVGIVKDFHNDNMKLAIPPSILSLEPQFFAFVSLRIRPVNVSTTLSFLEKTLGEVSREIYPDRPFNFQYSFIDDDFRRKYPEEEKVRQIFLIFGFLAVMVACLGLFGLASFTLEQRTKEIGVRKVLGASIHSLVLLIAKEFMKLVLVSNILAWPLAYFAMHRWLENFAYRINIKPDIFIFSGIIAFIIAMFTVCFHSMKAARTNPVDSLRYE
jgi:putative ABC transport system permease protein